MKNLDQFSKRVLSIAVSISMVLLSGSLFITTLNNSGQAIASPMNLDNLSISRQANTLKKQASDSIPGETIEDDVFAVQTFGMGIREGKLYFGILYNNNTIGLHKAEADGADVLIW